LLFNSLIPVHLTKGTWQPLYLTATVALVVAGPAIRNRNMES